MILKVLCQPFGCGNQITVGDGVIGGQGSGGSVDYHSEKFCGKIRGWLGDYHAWIGLDIRGLRRARAWCLITHKQVYRSGSRYCPIDTDSLGRFRGCRFAGWRPFLTGEWGWHVVLSFSDWGEQPVGKIVHLHCRGMILFLNIILKTTVRKNNHTLGYCGIVKLL